MESFVDVLVATFQATTPVVLIVLLGYTIAGRTDQNVAETLSWVARKVMGPCLIIYTLAPSRSLTFTSLSTYSMIPIMCLITHIMSLIVGVTLNRLFRAPAWIIDSLSYNNVSSVPLALLLSLSRLTTHDSGPLAHLKWRILDDTIEETHRGLLYIILTWWITDAIRALVKPLVDHYKVYHPRIQLSITDEDDDNASLPASAESDTESVDITNVGSADVIDPYRAAATETSPLIPRSTNILNAESRRDLARHLNPTFLAGLFGLLVAVISPLKATLTDPDMWLWRTVGGGLKLMGLSFVAIDLLSTGMALKKRQSTTDKQPPVLGYVLLISLWRFFALPAISIAITNAIRASSPLWFFSRDPVLVFVIASTVISPPILPFQTNSVVSSLTTVLYLIYPLASLAICYSISTPGSGISFSTDFDFKEALKKAVGGGIAGALAMILQVLTLMWIRTTMNYQYRYGGKFMETLKKLWEEGGLKRLYAGLGAALFQAPISRFGDTAANAGIVALLSPLTWPVLVKTIAASLASALFRMTLTPIDTLKTTQQTKGGVEGLRLLKARVKKYGIGCLWWGAIATAGATFVGHYPWFGTYNFLQTHLPVAHNFFQKLLRQAFIGFASSVVSDTVSNSLRVVKTYRQVHETNVGYLEAAQHVLQEEGWRGLFGRGLITRYVANGLQGLLFSVLWKFFSEIISK